MEVKGLIKQVDRESKNKVFDKALIKYLTDFLRWMLYQNDDEQYAFRNTRHDLKQIINQVLTKGSDQEKFVKEAKNDIQTKKLYMEFTS